MTIKLGVVMDSLDSINIKKDSTVAMLLEAQSRDWLVLYIQQDWMYLAHHVARSKVHELKIDLQAESWYQLGPEIDISLAELDVILMRKDPPFDMDYIYSTYLLERAEQQGTLVINKPQSLRDANEKLFTSEFPECMPPTLVSSQARHLKNFYQQHEDIILKPLEGMGGASIFRVKNGDSNLSVIIETLTDYGKHLIMAQKFIPEISQGDKRILLINGNPIPYALARVPAKGETRGNLAAGGTGVGISLTQRDYWICEQLAPKLKEMGLIFVGIDVIGDYLTEINVTSPTCIRELDAQFNLNISAELMDWIAEQRQ